MANTMNNLGRRKTVVSSLHLQGNVHNVPCPSMSMSCQFVGGTSSPNFQDHVSRGCSSVFFIHWALSWRAVGGTGQGKKSLQ